MIEELDEVVWLISAALDDHAGTRAPEHQGWVRLGKLAEEVGEATAALIGAEGSNPRKGVTHDLGDVAKELLDVAVTALGAYEHFTHTQSAGTDLLWHLRTVLERHERETNAALRTIEEAEAKGLTYCGRCWGAHPRELA